VPAPLLRMREGDLAARFKTQTDLLLTQRLIVQPEVELDAYSRADAARDQQAGRSDCATSFDPTSRLTLG
jgi:copper resistance protein B